MLIESLNGFEPRSSHRDDLVFAMGHQRGQTRGHISLVVRNQNTHSCPGRTFHARYVLVSDWVDQMAAPPRNQSNLTAVTAILPPKHTSTSAPGVRCRN